SEQNRCTERNAETIHLRCRHNVTRIEVAFVEGSNDESAAAASGQDTEPGRHIHERGIVDQSTEQCRRAKPSSDHASNEGDDRTGVTKIDKHTASKTPKRINIRSFEDRHAPDHFK